MSRTRKANQRKRLKAVDEVIEVVASTGLMTKSLVGWAFWLGEEASKAGDANKMGNATSPCNRNEP